MTAALLFKGRAELDWAGCYDRLINRAVGRAIELVCYSERHHVIPRSIGGPDESRNIVRLTPEEHYVAHLLLVKMLPHRRELVFAAKQMTIGNRRSNKLYGWLRRRFVAAMRIQATGRKHTPEARAKMSSARLGVPRATPHSAETKAKMSVAAKGRTKSAAHCAAMSVGQKKRFSDSTARAKQAAHLRTKVHNRKQEAGVSGFNGVELLSTGRWRARVYVKRKPVHVGVYATAEEANAARIAFSVNK